MIFEYLGMKGYMYNIYQWTNERWHRYVGNEWIIIYAKLEKEMRLNDEWMYEDECTEYDYRINEWWTNV